jgi:hypothetical protein
MLNTQCLKAIADQRLFFIVVKIHHGTPAYTIGSIYNISVSRPLSPALAAI